MIELAVIVTVALLAAMFGGYWTGRQQGIRIERHRLVLERAAMQQERLHRANQLRTAGRLFEPHPDNGPPSVSRRISVVSQTPERPDRPPTRM